MFEMIASAMMMGGEAFFMPLRMTGAIVLGPAALEPTYSFWAAALAGIFVHMMLAVIYGGVFALIFGGLRSASVDIGVGAAYGLSLWLINFYLMAPLAFPWFTEANPVIQVVAHTFFFGAVLGWYVWWARSRAEHHEYSACDRLCAHLPVSDWAVDPTYPSIRPWRWIGADFN